MIMYVCLILCCFIPQTFYWSHCHHFNSLISLNFDIVFLVYITPFSIEFNLIFHITVQAGTRDSVPELALPGRHLALMPPTALPSPWKSMPAATIRWRPYQQRLFISTTSTIQPTSHSQLTCASVLGESRHSLSDQMSHFLETEPMAIVWLQASPESICGDYFQTRSEAYSLVLLLRCCLASSSKTASCSFLSACQNRATPRTQTRPCAASQ